VTVNNEAAPTDLSFNVTKSSCDSSDGKVEISGVTGGTSPYEYSFDGGAFDTTTLYPGLSSGTYQVTVKDSNGCTFSENVSVNDQGGPNDMSFSISAETCGNNNGSVEITGVSGGISPYQYSFDGGSFSSNTLYNSLSSGNYTVIVKDSNGCQYSETVTVDGYPAITSLNLNIEDETCSDNNGLIEIQGVSGGTAPYRYSLNGSSFTSTTMYDSLSGGTYTLAVKDSMGCTYNDTVNLTNKVGPSDISFNVTDATCGNDDGVVDITGVTGVATPYEYSFDGSAFSSNTSYDSLAVGTYTVVVKDDNGCKYTETVTVSDNGSVSIDSVITTDESCIGANDGYIEVQASNATKYSIDSGLNFQSSSTFDSLSNGTYEVIAEDDSGCSDAAQVTINVGDSVLANATADKDTVIVDSTVSFSSNGSVGTNYTWDFDNEDSSSIPDPSYRYSSTGTYQVVLTVSNNSCTDKDTITVIVDKNTGIASRNTEDVNLNIYPNPTKGNVNLSITMEQAEDIDISVLNVLGDVVLNKKVDNVKKENIKLNLQGRSAGFYMLRIRMGDKVINEKLQLLSR
ncbi:MAG: T9SS type A sorting domain-containing protein, partial [Flavobacteriales bacterium]